MPSAAGPPAVRSSCPLALSIASRISSASSRRAEKRPSQRLSGSRETSSSSATLARRYAADSMMRLWSVFKDQPSATKRAASRSRSFGCVGDSESMPKLFGVRTRPSPKCHCQTRLTMTRAVSGFAADATQRAARAGRSRNEWAVERHPQRIAASGA